MFTKLPHEKKAIIYRFSDVCRKSFNLYMYHISPEVMAHCIAFYFVLIVCFNIIIQWIKNIFTIEVKPNVSEWQGFFHQFRFPLQKLQLYNYGSNPVL